MSDSASDQVICEDALDRILAARCEERDLEPSVARHVEACSACRGAMDQLASASPETLAIAVLVRGISR